LFGVRVNPSLPSESQKLDYCGAKEWFKQCISDLTLRFLKKEKRDETFLMESSSGP